MMVEAGAVSKSGVMDEVRDRRMVARQYVVILICLIVNLVDGFDVLAMAFTAPTLAKLWQLHPEQVGILLSAGLAGMALGALTLSSLADVIGRRPITLLCLGLVTAGMFGAGMSSRYTQLLFARLVTGVGIGAMISSNSALLVEYASVRGRDIALGLMAVMFPAGAVIGGAVSVALLKNHGWQPVFITGGVATLAMLLACVIGLPESIDYLLARARAERLPQINRLLASLGTAPLAELPLPDAGTMTTRNPRHLFRAPHRRTLLQLIVIMFLTMLSFYFILNWAPKLLVQRGLPGDTGIFSGILINVGGMVGGISLGLLMRLAGVRVSTTSVLAGMAAGIGLFGLTAGSPALLGPVALALGFMMYGSMVVTFMLMSTSFPAPLRATAIGVCTTSGRVGSVLGPYLGGVLLAHGQTVTATCAILSVPVLAASIIFTSTGIGRATSSAPKR